MWEESWRFRGKGNLCRRIGRWLFLIWNEVMDKKASDKKVIQVNLKVICSIREIESRGLNEVGGKGSLDVKKMIVNSIL